MVRSETRHTWRCTCSLVLVSRQCTHLRRRCRSDGGLRACSHLFLQHLFSRRVLAAQYLGFLRAAALRRYSLPCAARACRVCERWQVVRLSSAYCSLAPSWRCVIPHWCKTHRHSSVSRIFLSAKAASASRTGVWHGKEGKNARSLAGGMKVSTTSSTPTTTRQCTVPRSGTTARITLSLIGLCRVDLLGRHSTSDSSVSRSR